MKYLILSAFGLFNLSMAKDLPEVYFVDSIVEVIGEEAWGAYNPYFNIILIENGMNEKDELGVLAHEFAHWAFYEMSLHYRKNYCHIAEMRQFYATEYANTSCEENFAEAVAIFTMDGGLSDKVIERLITRPVKLLNQRLNDSL